MVNSKQCSLLSFPLIAVLVAACEPNAESTNSRLNDSFYPSVSSAQSQKVDNVSKSLITGHSDSDTENAWFCTLTEKNVFKSRDVIHFISTGVAKINSDVGTWQFVDGILTFSVDGLSQSWNGVSVNSRFLEQDFFTADSNDSSEFKIFCNWSGPPRPSYLLDEPTGGSGSGSGADVSADTEGAEIWLVTDKSVNSQNRYWSCLVDDSITLSYKFFEDGTGFVSSLIRWKETNDDSIELMYNDSNKEIISKIVFQNTEFGSNTSFVAELNSTHSLNCNLVGSPRAVSWEEFSE